MMAKAQWTPASFEIAVGDHESPGGLDDIRERRETVLGETCGPFGIYKADGRFWAVTHLLTGRMLVDAESKRAAKRFCREVADLTDWATVQPGKCPPAIRDAVIVAFHRARGAMFVDPAPTVPERAGAGT